MLPDVKSKTQDGEILKKEEAKMILSKLQPEDVLVLLDERGQEFSSVGLANWLEKKLASPGRRMVFLVGGAFGFSPEIYGRANDKISLSKLTFSHQMVRLIFVEQLYRAYTILKGEPYHHK